MGATARRFGPIAVPRGWAVAAILALLVLGAGLVRAAPLWPEAAGLQESPYDDEGVYAAAAQLLAQGAQPYRDFIYAHPPLGPPLLLPATLYHFTPWGSPTSFMMLRYAAVAYGALTVGLLFLLSWRLWGLAGGLFSGLLLLLDPASVWAGRHVMLEGPLLCLLALAALLYALARERARPPAALLAAAGFVAAAAGGVKLQGLLLLAAFLLDLAARRRWRQSLAVLAGAALLWAPLWGYLFALRAADPLGQFIWLQLLRPADGAVGLADRLRSIGDEAPLVLAAATLALLAAPAFRRPSGPPRLAPAWSLLPWWTLLVALTLLSSRSFYAHYVAHLALPLAALAGALPAALGRLLRAGARPGGRRRGGGRRPPRPGPARLQRGGRRAPAAPRPSLPDPRALRRRRGAARPAGLRARRADPLPRRAAPRARRSRPLHRRQLRDAPLPRFGNRGAARARIGPPRRPAAPAGPLRRDVAPARRSCSARAWRARTWSSSTRRAPGG